MAIPNHAVRDVLEVYVPVNDQNGGEALVRRTRQPRVFPRVHVGNEPVRLIWKVDPAAHREALAALKAVCRHVTRIGHSSSLVWVRVEDHGPLMPPTHTVDPLHGVHSLRVTNAGAFGRLTQWFKIAAIEAYEAAELQIAIAKPKDKKALKAKLVENYPRGKPTSQRPAFPLRVHYRPLEPEPSPHPHSHFDPNFIVLREADEATQTFGLESTAQILTALRGLIQRNSPQQPPPSWVSGHEPSGEKLQSSPHIALIPLAFVGTDNPYADGHLMGVGIVFPRSVAHRERANVFARMLFDEENNKEAVLPLRMKEAGEWHVVRDTSQLHQQTLKIETYVRASRCWASVTPVVLDRLPKADRAMDPIGWRAECANTITTSCLNIGLSAPIAVRVEKTPFFKGSLRAMPGQGGFPQLRKDKFQVHAKIEFDQPVIGPVLIGAGRYRGYGLCRPWGDD
jgi:CRISPR-associated protein Csb2